MKAYPVEEEHLGAILRVAMPRAVGSAPFLTRYLPARGRQRIVPVPAQIQTYRG
jgi:hypothetical protein